MSIHIEYASFRFADLPSAVQSHCLGFLSPQETLVCHRVNRQSNVLCRAIFPRNAASNLKNEMKAGLTELAGAILPPELIKLILAYSGRTFTPDEVYHFAMRHTKRYFGRNFLQLLGGPRIYASLPTVDNEQSSTLPKMFKSMHRGRLSLTVTLRTNLTERSTQKFYSYKGNNNLVGEGRPKIFKRDTVVSYGGGGELFPLNFYIQDQFGEIFDRLRRVFSGTDLHTNLDLPWVAAVQERRLTAGISEQLSLALLFTKNEAFSGVQIRKLVNEYLGPFSIMMMQEYQKYDTSCDSSLTKLIGGACLWKSTYPAMVWNELWRGPQDSMNFSDFLSRMQEKQWSACLVGNNAFLLNLRNKWTMEEGIFMFQSRLGKIHTYDARGEFRWYSSCGYQFVTTILLGRHPYWELLVPRRPAPPVARKKTCCDLRQRMSCAIQ